MIAVDAMGGDYAPEQIVLGALLASKDGISVALFGDEVCISSLLDSFDSSWNDYKISIFHSDQKISMAESPASVIKNKPRSSLVQSFKSVKDGVCSAVVSAGNSGAVMVCSMFILGRISGVERPAIIGNLPTLKKTVFFLDIGVNADCKPKNLLQFAKMANVYTKEVFGRKKPVIVLLSNGHEEGKGSLLARKSFELLKNEKDLNFAGNIEPYGIFKGDTDIIVTDGFSGNLVLKTIESMLKNFDVRDYNLIDQGALLLGVNGVVVLAHGNADSKSIKRAILLAYKHSYNNKESHDGKRKYEESIANVFK